MMPLNSATGMELNGIILKKMSLMTLMTSLKEDKPNEVKIGLL